MAEWSIAAVLKTVEGQTSGGSNPSLSAKENRCPGRGILISAGVESLLSKASGNENGRREAPHLFSFSLSLQVMAEGQSLSRRKTILIDMFFNVTGNNQCKNKRSIKYCP